MCALRARHRECSRILPIHPLQSTGPRKTAKVLHIQKAGCDKLPIRISVTQSHTLKIQKKPPLQAESQRRSSSVLMPFFPLVYEVTAFVRLQRSKLMKMFPYLAAVPSAGWTHYLLLIPRPIA
jgi:hypothetical protein